MVDEDSAAVEFDVQVASRLHGAVALGLLLEVACQAGEEGSGGQVDFRGCQGAEGAIGSLDFEKTVPVGISPG